MWATSHWPYPQTTDATVDTGKAGEYARIRDVQTGIYRTPGGVEYGGVKARKATATLNDYAGSNFAASTKDCVWNVWDETLSGQQIAVHGALYFQSAWWTVIGVAGRRADGVQTRALCRKEV